MFNLFDVFKSSLREEEDSGSAGDLAALSDEKDIPAVVAEGSPAVENEEEEEEVEEEEEEEKEDLSLSESPAGRPSLKLITTKFPTILKEIPALRGIYFREAEYSKLFTSVQEAKEVDENAKAFNELNNDITVGNGSKLFAAIAQVDPKNLDRLAENFVDHLTEHRPNAIIKLANPIMQSVVRQMYDAGKMNRNDNMTNAAIYAAEFFFGLKDGEAVATGEKTAPKSESVKKPEVSSQQYEAQTLEVSQTIYKDLQNAITYEDSLGFSEFIKSAITQKVISEVSESMGKDAAHTAYMGKLWTVYDGSPAAKARIISAFMARAKQLIPRSKAKLISEAAGKPVSSEKLKQDVKINRDRATSGIGKPVSGNNIPVNAKTINFKDSSDWDILNDKITLKRN